MSSELSRITILTERVQCKIASGDKDAVWYTIARVDGTSRIGVGEEDAHFQAYRVRAGEFCGLVADLKKVGCTVLPTDEEVMLYCVLSEIGDSRVIYQLQKLTPKPFGVETRAVVFVTTTVAKVLEFIDSVKELKELPSPTTTGKRPACESVADDESDTKRDKPGQ